MPGCSGQDRMSGASVSHRSHGVSNQAGRIFWDDNHIPSCPLTLLCSVPPPHLRKGGIFVLVELTNQITLLVISIMNVPSHS